MDFSNHERLCLYITKLFNINTYIINEHYEVHHSNIISRIPTLLAPYIHSSPTKHMHKYNDMKDCNLLIGKTIYHFSYIRMNSMLNQKNPILIIIGPFLSHEPDSAMMRDIISKTNLPLSLRDLLKQYYRSLPILHDEQAILLAQMGDELSHKLKQTYSEPSVKFIDNSHFLAPSIANHEDENTSSLNMENIEKLYDDENAFLHAVANGDYHKAIRYMTLNSETSNIIDRLPTNMTRSLKNLSFVLNTLLRKTVEKSGVHPMYAHSLSSKYAVAIEANEASDMDMLIHDMVRDYCTVVESNTTAQYSSLVRKMIEHIRFNLDKPITLDLFSSMLNASPSKLSRAFKSEVGESMTTYINHLRVQEAIHLMHTDQYSLTQISYFVGFNDSNYFARTFKRIIGQTPSEFRQGLKRNDAIDF